MFVALVIPLLLMPPNEFPQLLFHLINVHVEEDSFQIFNNGSLTHTATALHIIWWQVESTVLVYLVHGRVHAHNLTENGPIHNSKATHCCWPLEQSKDTHLPSVDFKFSFIVRDDAQE